VLGSPNSTRGIYAIRYSTVAFSLAVLFWKTQNGAQQNALTIYLVLAAVLMVLGQAATSNSSKEVNQSGRGRTLTPMDVFLVYWGSLLLIFARSLAGVQIPNIVMLCAIAVAFCSGCYGIISTHRRRLYR
jgi:membrane protein insertase Oxa1/YidC/SpoIIIJ